MQRTPVVAVPDVPGIDLAFRPATYFWPLSLETHLRSRVKGALRNAALRQQLAAGGHASLPAFLAASALREPARQVLGRIHPACMGGEYLPDLRPNEVAIARITIASTTQDVTCVYACRGQNRIRYRVVDEYDGDTLCGRATRTSRRPLTLGELESFFDGAWSLFDVLAMNFGDRGYDPDEMLRFVVGVESEFYPQIGALYTHRIAVWGATRRAQLGGERAR